MQRIREKIFENCFDNLGKGGQLKLSFHKSMLNLLCFLFCGCIFFLAAVPAAAGNIIIDDILETIEKKYAKKSFEADFRQISKLAALDITEIASGKAVFSHPGKMRWTYLEPEHHEIITNGVSLWIYRPEEHQVMKGNASSFFNAGAGGAFLSDISLVRKHYVARIKEVNQEYVEIELYTKKKTPDISLIEIRISQETSEIVRVTTHNTYDDTTLFEFSNIQFAKIDPGVFEFELPEDINIIEME